ncbi:TetR family transcriptional regulator [Knoellia sinensis KCTC 19936]|uniref:TetR family transcriptional regulator n=1 Tax=Knoellia sinensis KCTC 19936 TaxID=1385520 RepID=A0A0A0IZR9_9MICO|nr:TetR family transcriptional regulator C-terminal domain-containing protein [Knoellia sinensis]KGN29959.1 TetR family transcriptional regulator [Knoellia sinensis KCTC 19936]
MPKVVDHAARRAELGAAVRRVVARSGVEGASVRAVAAESGWSTGAMRYYFATQDELLDFAFDASLADIPLRLQRILDEQEPGFDRAQALLEEMLPLDDDRLAEVRVYLAFMARSRTVDGRPGLAEQTWHGERHICGLAIADVTGLDHPVEVGVVPAALAALVDDLHVFVDGLTFLGATVPDQMPPTKARALLRSRLEAVVRL